MKAEGANFEVQNNGACADEADTAVQVNDIQHGLVFGVSAKPARIP
jgi:hypothetical protein